MIQSTGTHEPSVGTLLKDLADESRTLLRQEVQLAKAELGEKAAKLGRNVAYIAVGGAVAYAGLLALIAAASIGLFVLLTTQTQMQASTAVWLGPLIVGAVVTLIGYIFVQKAIYTLKHESLAPEKTIQTMRENKEWLKDQMTTSDQRTSVNRMS